MREGKGGRKKEGPFRKGGNERVRVGGTRRHRKGRGKDSMMKMREGKEKGRLCKRR